LRRKQLGDDSFLSLGCGGWAIFKKYILTRWINLHRQYRKTAVKATEIKLTFIAKLQTFKYQIPTHTANFTALRQIALPTDKLRLENRTILLL
jgi:hypothetical protein